MTGETLDGDDRIIDAAEREMRYLSGVLHEDLCQSLAALGMRVDVIVRAASRNRSIPFEDFSGLKIIVEGAIDQARALSKSLNPRVAELGGYGLMTMLQQLATERSRHIPCDFRCETPIAISDDHLACTLFRIAQECCRFEPKNSKLKRIRISLFQEQNCIHLEVRFEGKNLHKEKDLQGSELMHARARSVGGKLQLRSTPTCATILCMVPIPGAGLPAKKV